MPILQNLISNNIILCKKGDYLWNSLVVVASAFFELVFHFYELKWKIYENIWEKRRFDIYLGSLLSNGTLSILTIAPKKEGLGESPKPSLCKLNQPVLR